MNKKHINRNVILFMLIVLFWGGEVLSADTYYGLKEAAYSLIVKHESLDSFIENVDTVSSKQLRNHRDFMDLYIVFQRLTGSSVIEKDDGTKIAWTDNGYLGTGVNYISDEELEKSAAAVMELSDAAQAGNAKFLYVMAPVKGTWEEYPAGVDNFAVSNHNRFVSMLEDKEVPTLDLYKEMKKCQMGEEAYFKTDHHWKPLTGFWGFDKICQNLKERYSFDYNMQFTDIENYTVTTIPDSFLGSTGKKIGTAFGMVDVDDFDVISPKFETAFIEERPFADHVRQGDFKETMCYPERLVGELTEKNDYAYYSGGDFRLQILTNLNHPDGKTFVVVRDSYASTVTPFLSMVAKQVYVTDVRNFEWYVGEKQNIFEMIEDIQPDYVIVLYCGAETDIYGRYDFH